MGLSDAIEFINELGNFFQLAASVISCIRSRWNGTQEAPLKQEDLLQLKSGLQRLTDTLPSMYNLINRAEWKFHVSSVKELLPNLKDAVYDAEDLLDEFKWYKLKLETEGNKDASQMSESSFVEFFRSVTSGSFNKVTDIQTRLDRLAAQLEKMGLPDATPRFDKSVRPPTTSFRTEPNILGRDKELEAVMRLLGVPAPDHGSSSRSTSKRKRTASGATDSTEQIRIPVLPIVGIGGVGKTTLAQEITTRPSVKSHFDKTIWICVSDDFDEEKFTKTMIKDLSGKEQKTDNLDELQKVLAKEVGKKRFLLILDDIWTAALNDEQRWSKFCAPLTKVLKGSMLLVTTRFAKVADIVGTMDSIVLEGLNEDVFWDFFKLCVFGSKDSHIDPQLEQIGRRILVKLKGTPLAAKTIGRLLRKSLTSAHWNDILNNELWQIDQKESDILPALRLSYMYLPFYLKRCFSFCAVYPKDHIFEKDVLAEIWVAEGFVEPQGSTPLQSIGEDYFEELVNLSFFHKLRGKYVIHDLMHDMALLVSKGECFSVNNTKGVGDIPPNVRHLFILSNSGVKHSDLKSLCKHRKLRTLLCNKIFGGKTASSLMDRWSDQLQCLRVLSCAFKMKLLPARIGNLKHLRYLGITTGCEFWIVPSSFWNLYNLQVLHGSNSGFDRVYDVRKLINLKKFEPCVHGMIVDAAELGEQIELIKKFTDIRDLVINNLSAISKDHAAKVELRKRKSLRWLSLTWSSLRSPEHNEIEVFQALQPPTSVYSVHIEGYPGEYLPVWFAGSDGLDATPGPGKILSLLKELSIKGCPNISDCTLEQFLQPSYVPSIRKIKISHCRDVKSVRIEHFEDSLEELQVYGCPSITYLLAPSIRNLKVEYSGNLGDSIDCSSLTTLHLIRNNVASIDLRKWSLPVLQELQISNYSCLVSVRASGSEQVPTTDVSSLGTARRSTAKFPLLTHLTIESCCKLENLDDLLTDECLPAIKELTISSCPSLNWQSGKKLPSSIEKLQSCDSGDITPSCQRK